MPLFKGEGYKCTPNKAIAYITRSDKAALVTSLNLDDGESYAEQFVETAHSFGKGKKFDERKYYHFKLSCDPHDGITPVQSQRLAEDLAQELFHDHECVIATHTDTAIVHTHIIVNSINFDTGLKLHVTNEQYAAMKDRANSLGVEYGCQQLDWRHPSDKKVTQAEHHLRNNGKTSWKDNLCDLLDSALTECDSFISLRNYLEKYDVTMPKLTEKSISFLHGGQKKPVRGDTLGAAYSRAAIEDSLKQNREQSRRPMTINEKLERNKAILAARNMATAPARHIVERSAQSTPYGRQSMEARLEAARLDAARINTENKATWQAAVQEHSVGTSPAPGHKQVYCQNFSRVKTIPLTFRQKLRAILLGKNHAAGRVPFDYRGSVQAKYNIKLTVDTLEFLGRNGVSSYGDMKKRMRMLAGKAGKAELELKQVNGDIVQKRRVHEALMGFQKNERIAEQYMHKVMFRDNFFKLHEEELKSYAKAQEFLRVCGVDPHSSAPQLRAKLDELHSRQASLIGELDTTREELKQWQLVEGNLRKILEDRLPKYRLDVEHKKQKAPGREDRGR